ncbi:MAG: DUF1513 domain-containing protein [Proteobacteria bacterium]|nr:DUF1513 domain-containing protein [Pseudomonadota bacterium]
MTPRTPTSSRDVGRRCFLVGGGATLAIGLTTPLSRVLARESVEGRALYLGGRGDGGDRFWLTGFDDTGAARFDIAMPGRPHGIAVRPDSAESVAFARRPGTFAVVFDAAAGVETGRFEAAEGRHFYGHGLFTADGRHLLTPENDYGRGRSVIGLRDAADGYRQVGELQVEGVGPHDLRLMPDGKTLAVAVGGIRTHPESGRAKLNLETMDPALSVMEIESGRTLDSFRLASRYHKLSIRHLDVTAEGRVAVAMQYEGGKGDCVPLAALFDGGGLRPLAVPDALERRMRQYAGSVAFDRGGRYLAVTCPRGNLVVIWDAADGALLYEVPFADVCGIAPAMQDGGFILTGAAGHIARFDVAPGRLADLPPHGTGGWDNHLIASSG